MAARKETVIIEEAKTRMLAHMAQQKEEEHLDAQRRAAELHRGVMVFIDAMKDTFPKGIKVDPAVVFDSTNSLDQWVRSALHATYEKRKGVSTDIMLLAADHGGEPGITLAVVNANVVPSSTQWIVISADLRTVDGGIGFHIYERDKANPDIVSSRSLVASDIEASKRNQHELMQKLLSYGEPMLALAADIYKRAVNAHINRHPLKRSGGSGVSTN